MVDEAEGAFGGVGDKVKGGGLENGVFGAGLSEAVLNVEVGAFRGEFAEVAEAGDALGQGVIDGEA